MCEAGVRAPLLGSCRITLTIMVFFGVYHLMALRFNLSMALVCMTRDPTSQAGAANKSTGCGEAEEGRGGVNSTEEVVVEETEGDEAEFSWDKQLQGALLSSFFYGYIVTQVDFRHIQVRETQLAS